MASANRVVRMTSVDAWHGGVEADSASECAVVLAEMQRAPARDWTGQEMRQALLSRGNGDYQIGTLSRVFGQLAALGMIWQDEAHTRKCSVSKRRVMARRLVTKGQGSLFS